MSQKISNIKLLKKYISESGRILPSRITSVSLKKQREILGAYDFHRVAKENYDCSSIIAYRNFRNSF